MKKGMQTLFALIGICTAALCWLDVTYWIDPATGFPLVGSIWLRYGMAIILYLLGAAAAYLVWNKPIQHLQKSYSTAIIAALCGVSYALAGGMRLARVLPTVQSMVQSIAMSGQVNVKWCLWFFMRNSAADLFMGVTALLCSCSLLLQSRFWCAAQTEDQPVGGVYFTASGLLYLCGVALERFLGHAASIYRVYHMLQLLSVMVALVFLLALLRVYFFPETKRSHVCVRNGLGCFYICTCGEFVYTAVQGSRGLITTEDGINSLILGLTGLLGFLVSFQILKASARDAKTDLY